jgi:Zn-dependent protease
VESSRPQPENGDEAGALPSEVEAEFRRRAEARQAALPAEAPTQDGGWKKKLAALGPVGALLLVVLGKLKYLAFAGKFLLPMLKTGGTMLFSIVVYTQIWGWWFAVGFVLCILLHELGHVFVAWRLGMPVSAPIFIPMMGAVILQKQQAKSTWDEALIGIGGPIGGTLASLACLGLFYLTRNPLFQGLAFTGFTLNLFNMLPVFPLDGGWITGAISPRIWLFGTAALVAGFFTGYLRNPFIFILLLLSLPRLWHGLKTGSAAREGQAPATPTQRVMMGIAYVSLCIALAWLMSETHFRP